MADALPVLPLVVYFVLIPLVLVAAVFLAATMFSNWRAGRRPQAPPVYYQQAPMMAPPQYVQAPPVLTAGVFCGCGAPLEGAIDAVSGQPGVLRCTRPGCGRQAPVGPWAAMGD